jgi:hypothetical protein
MTSYLCVGSVDELHIHEERRVLFWQKGQYRAKIEGLAKFVEITSPR